MTQTTKLTVNQAIIIQAIERANTLLAITGDGYAHAKTLAEIIARHEGTRRALHRYANGIVRVGIYDKSGALIADFHGTESDLHIASGEG